MKFRKPRSPLSIAKSNIKRKAKKAVIPGYGKGGGTAISNPKKYIKKKVTGQPLSKKKKKGFFSLFK